VTARQQLIRASPARAWRLPHAVAQSRRPERTARRARRTCRQLARATGARGELRGKSDRLLPEREPQLLARRRQADPSIVLHARATALLGCAEPHQYIERSAPHPRG